MGPTKAITEVSLPVEIGMIEDWKSHALVSEIGLLTHDIGEVTVFSNGAAGFELRHPTGLRLRVDLSETLEVCVDLLAEELQARDEQSGEVA